MDGKKGTEMRCTSRTRAWVRDGLFILLVVVLVAYLVSGQSMGHFTKWSCLIQVLFFCLPGQAAVDWGIADVTILTVYTVAVSITAILCITTDVLDESVEEYGSTATHTMNIVIHYIAVLFVPWKIFSHESMAKSLVRAQTPVKVMRTMTLVVGLLAIFSVAFDPQQAYRVPFDNLLCFCILFAAAALVEAAVQFVGVVLQQTWNRRILERAKMLQADTAS